MRARGGNHKEGRGNCVRDASPPLSLQGEKDIGGCAFRGDHPDDVINENFANS